MLARTPLIETLPRVEAALNYAAPSAQRLRTYTYDPPAGMARSNIVPEPHVVTIRDARPVADDLTVDGEGFALVRHRSAVRDFYDEDEVQRLYYPEAAEIVARATGGSGVVVFDHTVRRREWGAEDRAPGVQRQPVGRVHVDYTEKSGPQRVRDLMGDRAEALLRGRVRIVNVWRPIRGPLHDAPLAVCDVRSMAPGDLVPSDLVYPDRTGETYSVAWNPAHRWFYVPAMQPDEALLLKCYDSRTDGPARFAPHTAFEDPTAPADLLPRESIEIRTLVFG